MIQTIHPDECIWDNSILQYQIVTDLDIKLKVQLHMDSAAILGIKMDADRRELSKV